MTPVRASALLRAGWLLWSCGIVASVAYALTDRSSEVAAGLAAVWYALAAAVFTYRWAVHAAARAASRRSRTAEVRRGAEEVASGLLMYRGERVFTLAEERELRGRGQYTLLEEWLRRTGAIDRRLAAEQTVPTTAFIAGPAPLWNGKVLITVEEMRRLRDQGVSPEAIRNMWLHRRQHAMLAGEDT